MLFPIRLSLFHGSDLVTGSVSGGLLSLCGNGSFLLFRRSGAEPQKPKSRGNGNGKTATAKAIRPAAKVKRKAKASKSQNRKAQNSKKKSRLYCIDSFCSTTYFLVFRRIWFNFLRCFTCNLVKNSLFNKPINA